VDVEGRLLGVLIVPADWSEQAGGRRLLERVLGDLPRLLRIWADQGYRGAWVAWLEQEYGITLDIVVRAADQQGFVVRPRRWVVERSLAWWGRNRRLSKEYEQLPASSATMVYLASCALLLKRLAPDPRAEPPYFRRRRAA